MNATLKRYAVLLLAALLVLLTAAIYLQVRSFGFSLVDDHGYVSENPIVQQGLNWRTVRWALTTNAMANWHPVTWLSYLVDVSLFGVGPGPMHLVNVFFHALNGVILFLVLKRMTGALWPSFLTAALFVVHPLHVESVAWISERKDVLSTMFWLLAMGAYAAYLARPRFARYVLVVLCMALGLMAKPMLVTLPCVLLLLDWWPLGRFRGMLSAPASAPALHHSKGKKTAPAVRGATAEAPRPSFRKAVGEKVPLLVLSVLSSVVTVVAQGRSNAMQQLDSLALHERFGNATVAYVRYLVKTVWPVDLSPLYPQIPGGPPWWQVVGAGLFLVAVTASVVALRRRPYFFVGWFWYLGTMVPVIGIIQVGPQAMADRYTYVPLIGVFMMVSWALADLVAAAPRAARAVAALGAVALLVLGALAYRQTGHWRDGVSLFEQAARVTPEDDGVQCYLGIALQRAGRDDEAVGHFVKALEKRPTYADARFYLGLIEQRQGRLDGAAAHYTVAVRHGKGLPNHANALNNLGSIQAQQGNLIEAEKSFRLAIEARVDFVDAVVNLGSVLARQRRYDEAQQEFRKALRVVPDHPHARRLLAEVERLRTRPDTKETAP